MLRVPSATDDAIDLKHSLQLVSDSLSRTVFHSVVLVDHSLVMTPVLWLMNRGRDQDANRKRRGQFEYMIQLHAVQVRFPRNFFARARRQRMIRRSGSRS